MLEWVARPPPGNRPDPAIELESLTARALAGRFFTTSTTWKPIEKRETSYSVLSWDLRMTPPVLRKPGDGFSDIPWFLPTPTRFSVVLPSIYWPHVWGGETEAQSGLGHMEYNSSPNSA